MGSNIPNGENKESCLVLKERKKERKKAKELGKKVVEH